MIDYTAQFATIAGLHLLAVASPGPDFAVVLRQSITHGRTVALRTSAGIGTGILVHTGYSLLGIGLLVKSSLLAFTVMKFAAAAYLAWIGFKALRSKPATSQPELAAAPRDAGLPGIDTRGAAQTDDETRSAFWLGFVTNALNPKATLFFLSVFSVVIDPHTPRLVQIGYGVWMAVMTAAWFSLVSIFFTQQRVRRTFLRLGHWFERAMGALLIALSVRLAFASAR